jgi:Flp pilus assembly protein TadB
LCWFWWFFCMSPKSTKTYKRPTKINTNMQKSHQNQHKHTKDPPKSTETYKRPTKINKNMRLLYACVDFGGSFVYLCWFWWVFCMFLLILVGLLYACVDFGVSFCMFLLILVDLLYACVHIHDP